MSSSLPPLENFDCDSDPHSIGVRWEKWKRGLCIYLEAANIEKPVKKRATLLHMGGLSLQEIYYNIPGAHVLSTDDPAIDIFNIALKKLDDYFAPKQSKVYERHILRLMKQEPGEKFEKFLVRLRRQADKCGFTNKEEHLIDQITEKCSSSELRKKILKGGDSMSLEDIIIEANTLENVNRQLEEFNQKTFSSSVINKIDVRQKNNTECTRCGSYKHVAQSMDCPARKVKCHKCGITGHFQKQCRTRKSMKRQFNPRTKDAKYAKKSRIEKDDQKEEEIDYVFQVDEESTIDCIVGGKHVKLLIDSGCKCNLLTDKTWSEMKKQKIHVFEMNKAPERTFYAYGSKEPLVVLGSFKATVEVNNKTEIAMFYVIKDGTKDIIGKNTSISLGVLKLGIQVNALVPAQANSNASVSAFPKFKDVLIEIPIEPEIKPVCQPYRRIPIPLENKINEKLQELLNLDIIEEVTEPSKWVSPMVPILKENGDVRICIDMRRANEAIVRENHPLPTMDQLLPNFKKAQVFSRLDVKNAFHQCEIHPDSRFITTFITSKGMFRYKRLMFGISCAPELFQKIMERILLKCEGTVNFIDDIVIFGSNRIEHDQRLQETLKVLEENNVLLNHDKCVYGVNKIDFLGHELSNAGIKPLNKYIDNIQTFRAPNTVEELQSFLGLVNFVGKWIPNLATLTESLRKVLRLKLGKNSNIEKVWTTEQNNAFLQLKKSLSSVRTLGYYDPEDKTQVIADASPVGLGAVLIQINSQGPRVIAYGNKSLTDCEKRYCQTEKEALALVWAVEHFKMYLYGKREFELISDHKPLEVIFGKKSKPCARIERWVLRLQSYNYKIVYRPGKSNIADPLSRLCSSEYSSVDYLCEGIDNYINQIIEHSRPIAVPLEDIKKNSSQDTEITKVRQGLYQHIWDPTVNIYKIFETELCFQDDILLRGNRIVIPQKLRTRVLMAAHEGHPGIVCMKQRLRTKVWWPKIDKDAETMVRNCKSCTLVSAPNPPIPMKRRQLPIEPWIDVAMDLLGPLPSGDYLLVVVDYFSRYKEIKITKSITSSDMIKLLKEIFSRLGYPVTITADNGKQFVSQEFRNYLQECGIVLHSTIPYWPQQNGEVERQNRSILKRIKISQIEKKNWKEELLYYLMMYNSTPHSVTGKTPSELFYKRQFRDKIPSYIDIENKDEQSEVKDRDKIVKEIGKNYSDRKRKAVDHNLHEGDKVVVRNFHKENKLTPTFAQSTHTITKSAPKSGDVEIRNDTTGEIYRRNVVHLKKIGGEWRLMNREQNQDSSLRGDDQDAGSSSDTEINDDNGIEDSIQSE